MTRFAGLREIDYQAKQMSDEVEHVLNSLDTTTRDDTDTAQPNAIITPLKRHGLPLAMYVGV